MKHSSITMLLVAGLILIAGCGEEESYSRYPSVCIPEFTSDDYIVQLSSEDPQVIYNAVCNLGDSAREMGNALWGKKADPESENWKEAQHVYTNICVQLQSENPMVLAASLRFLQLFAGSHEAQSELIDPVCRIDSSSALVQFEQVALLNRLVDDTTVVPEALLRRLLHSKSWIVSRSTYGLIGELSNDSLRSELLARYRSASDESDRLLLLKAYGNSSGPEMIELIMNELLSADSPKIRHAAFCSLLNNIETPMVQTWIIEHSAEFDPDEQGWIFGVAGEMDSDESGFNLMREMLIIGYAPEDEFLVEFIELESEIAGELPEDMSNEDLEAAQKQVAALEKVIATDLVLAERLTGLREKLAGEQNRYEILQAELDPLIDEFIEKAKTVLSQHEISDEKQQKFLKPISGLNAKRVITSTSP